MKSSAVVARWKHEPAWWRAVGGAGIRIPDGLCESTRPMQMLERAAQLSKPFWVKLQSALQLLLPCRQRLQVPCVRTVAVQADVVPFFGASGTVSKVRSRASRLTRPLRGGNVKLAPLKPLKPDGPLTAYPQRTPQLPSHGNRHICSVHAGLRA